LLERNKEANGNVVAVAFFILFGCSATQKAMPSFFLGALCHTFCAPFFSFSFFYGFVVLKKKKMTPSITFFGGFATKKWRPPPFFGGFAAKKVMAAMSSPSSMVAVVFYFIFVAPYGLVH
jgi:hypothetical protein